MLLRKPTADGSQTVYANESYMIAGFVARADDFTDPSGHCTLAVVPDDEYYAQRGIVVSQTKVYDARLSKLTAVRAGPPPWRGAGPSQRCRHPRRSGRPATRR